MSDDISNLEIARRYLAAIGSGEPEENVAVFAADVVQEEFPNRLMPQGAIRDLAALREAVERGRKVMTTQKYEVLNEIVSGDQVAVEVQLDRHVGGTFRLTSYRRPDAGAICDLPGIPWRQDRAATQLRLLRSIVSRPNNRLHPTSR